MLLMTRRFADPVWNGEARAAAWTPSCDVLEDKEENVIVEGEKLATNVRFASRRLSGCSQCRFHFAEVIDSEQDILESAQEVGTD